jgi:hypothetical protein
MSMRELRARADALDAVVRASPHDESSRAELTRLLDALARRDLDLEWRYVPAGTTPGFWMMAVPLSWAAACRLLDYSAPPEAMPRDRDQRDKTAMFTLAVDNRIRLQYCEDHTTRATDWHAHDPSITPRWRAGGEAPKSSQEVFGRPLRDPVDAPYTYERKPAVALAFDDATRLAEAASRRGGVAVSLPDEARWERAARGWHVDARYPWGDAPAERRADWDAFHAFRVLPSRTFPPNDYGLYAMVGGVWEWCTDVCEIPSIHPLGGQKDGPPRALRGGSWADSPDACTTSFRMALRPRAGGAYPNVGCRFVLSESTCHSG